MIESINPSYRVSIPSALMGIRRAEVIPSRLVLRVKVCRVAFFIPWLFKLHESSAFTLMCSLSWIPTTLILIFIVCNQEEGYKKRMRHIASSNKNHVRINELLL